MCTALAAAKKLNNTTGGPLGLTAAQTASPLAMMIEEDNPLAISPAQNIADNLQ